MMISSLKTTMAIVVLLCLGIISFASSKPIDVKYQHFLSVHGKHIKDETEYNKRVKIFEDNLNFIDETNSQEESFQLGLNKFADMTQEEYQQFLGFNSKQSENNASLEAHNNSNSTSGGSTNSTSTSTVTIDWRTKGAVNPIQNQGQCGSCWAFSATAAFEGSYFIKHGVLMKFSEQQLNDCSDSFGNNGCNGGIMNNAFKYLMSNSFCSLADYPYTATDAPCKNLSCSIDYSKVLSITNVTPKSGSALKTAINLQPVSVALNGGSRYFQLYKSGVLSNTKCGTTLNHAVVAVGYGTDSLYGDYWILRNSWGTSWGDQGYIRISAKSTYDSKGGMCGVLLLPSYPTVI